jgi:site-specific DNA recombinase
MGGNLPLGYDLQDRKPIIVEQEAELVRHFYTRYLELGSVLPLVRELDAKGLRTKSWVSRRGHQRGGTRFSCGAVYYILANRIYLGDIVHKGQVHAGEHSAIVNAELFNAVAAKLQSQRVKRTYRKSKSTSSPLTGKLFDSDGLPMRPTFGHGRGKRFYRYYVSETLLPVGQTTNNHNKSGERLSATRLERVLANTLSPILPAGCDAESVYVAINRIRLQKAHMRIRLDLAALIGQDDTERDILLRAQAIDEDAKVSGEMLTITITNQAIRRGKTLTATANIADDAERRRMLAELVRKSHALLARLNASPIAPELHGQMTVPVNEWSRQRMAIGLLAPDVQKMLLQGKAPPHVTPDMLISRDLPMDWDKQRCLLFAITDT